MPSMKRARLLDTQGRPLATADLSPRTDLGGHGSLIALDARPSHELLSYYFGRGGRGILIGVGGGARPGRILGTRWTPEGRVWVLQA